MAILELESFAIACHRDMSSLWGNVVTPSADWTWFSSLLGWFDSV
jgi:hypothetical protein